VIFQRLPWRVFYLARVLRASEHGADALIRGSKLRAAFLRSLRLLPLSAVLLSAAQTAHSQSAPQEGGDFSQNAQAKPLPTGTIIVKGVSASASDSVTPLPEAGSVAADAYTNKYFALTYALPSGWTQKYDGPPPSDSGYYVLSQIKSGDTNKLASRGVVLIAAQDLFFTLAPATNAFELVNYTKEKLQADHQVERQPSPVTIANHSFIRFDYFSPVAGLHWSVLATQIRCHMVEFVFTSRDAKLLDSLLQGMNKMKLPAEASPILGTGGDDVPVCIKDYARSESVVQKVDPVLSERRFNPIPVRIIIDQDGKVKHIHFLSAFPEQAKTITDALLQWRFKPYLRVGRATEVETGIVFGHTSKAAPSSAAAAVTE
jgi:hypothetical protein